jgi:hypothetical protein
MLHQGKMLSLRDQQHGDLDTGDFVLEALGQRWAGELCQNDYLAPDYFSSEAQDAVRWTYYRDMTEGQNTLSIGGQNQLVDQAPPTTYGTTGDKQSSLDFSASSSSAAFMWTDMSTVYSNHAYVSPSSACWRFQVLSRSRADYAISRCRTSVKRGIRVYNERRQVLLQDEIVGADAAGQWRMQTNASIAYSDDSRTATLSLGGQTLQASILDSSANVTFVTLPANRTANAPDLTVSGGTDLPNPGVSVLAINFPQGDSTIEVLFNPQWSGLSASDYKTPSSVPLSSWSTTSHT